MKALVFVEPGKMEIREVSRPVCERGGLLVKVETCGFCGSDLRTYRYGHSRVTPPWIIGHEIAGVVAELGEGVVGFLPGERVAVAPPVYCGTCYYCRQSVFYLCQNSPPAWGSLF
ncbi:MAG: alcohol dehydrogenase catalytic domain-containing protein [Candidatus Atribacteria bacterium]|nr:alcohol dehydrogenase catalytic domain-containing protein [Candidatus Atribacteria bacterium]